jgi:dihydrofolate reductase
VSGSGTPVRALLADGLVDEFHLFVYPLTSGAGRGLFAMAYPPRSSTLAASEAHGNGAVYLAYRQPA